MTSDDDRQNRQAKIAAAAPRTSKARPVAIIVAIVAVLAIGGAVAYGAIVNRAPDAATARDYPQGATGSAGGIVINADKVKPGAPTLDIYEDFQCPACKQAEDQLGPEIKKMSQAGEAKVVFHMKDFLDAAIEAQRQVPNPASSLRAANAAACAADAGKFEAYHDAIYAKQPQEGAGYSAADLTAVAKTAGLSGSELSTWQTCTNDGKYNDYVKRVEEATAKAGVNKTPTFQVNGKDFDLGKLQTIADFRTQVLAAGGASGSSSASPSASPSASK